MKKLLFILNLIVKYINMKLFTSTKGKKMKFFHKVHYLLLIFAFTTSCSLFDSNQNNTPNITPEKESVKIGLSLPTQTQERWVKDRIIMETEALLTGIDLKIQISNNDPITQENQCDILFAQDIKVLILAPSDAISSAKIVEKAKKNNVKVISYDRLIMNSDIDIYLTFDNVKVGELQASYITNLVPKGNYLLIRGASTDNNSKLFKNGAMNILKPYIDKGDIKIIYEDEAKNWQEDEAYEIMNKALDYSKNNIQAVIAPNDVTAGGCIRALTEKNMNFIPISGQDSELDAVRRIVKGTQTMSVFKDTRILGKEAISIAKKLANNEKIVSTNVIFNNKSEINSIFLDPYLIDKSNINKLLIETGYLKKDEVYN